MKESYFQKKRDILLLRAKEELLKFHIFLNYESEEFQIQQEISLILISTLIRKCYELQLIPGNKEIIRNLNSIMHMHSVIVLEGGKLIIESDHDIKKDKKGVLIDEVFVNKIISIIDAILMTNLEVEFHENMEILKHK